MTTLKAIARGIVGVYNWFLNTLVFISCALIIFMMVSICGSIIFRKTIVDFGWALEVSELILIIITMFGAGWLLRTAGHIRVDIVATHIHGKRKAIYNAIIFSAVSLICLCFTGIGIRAVYDAWSTGTIEYKVYFQYKKWILHSLFPVAGFVMFVESTKLAFINYANFFSGNHNMDE